VLIETSAKGSQEPPTSGTDISGFSVDVKLIFLQQKLENFRIGLAMNRVKKLTETLMMLLKGEFTGYIKINFSQGSIGRVEKFEEFDVAVIRAATGNDNMEAKDF
jgi:hypothetical protein